MLTPSRTRLDAREAGRWGLDVAKDVSEALEGGAIPFSRTLSRLLGLKRKGPRERLLSDRQQEFLYEISHRRNKLSCFLVADNLHFWDEKSLQFLAQVSRGLWDQEYPELPKVRFLLVWTEDEAPKYFQATISSLFGTELPSFKLSYVDQATFRGVFRAMGAPVSVPDEIIDRIYGVCRGDLLFGMQFAQLVSGSSDTNISLSESEDISRALARVLTTKLERLGSSADTLRDFMACLCTIGKALPERELNCLFTNDKDRLNWCLDHARRLGLVEPIDDGIRVTHDEIVRAFQVIAPEGRTDWHKKFASCLSQLRPADYSLRALHLENGANPAAAMVCRAHAALKLERQMEITSAEELCAAAMPLDVPLRTFLSHVGEALAEERRHAYTDAVNLLDNAPLNVADTLVAERDLILSRMLARLRTKSANERALHLLEEWSSLREREVDLWLRIMEARVVVLSHLNRRDEARQIEKEIRQVCDQRSSFDPAAAQVDLRLRRRAESIHAPPIAHDRLKRAIAYLDPQGDGTTPRNIVEYIRTLNNLGANEMVLGDFEKAFERIAMAYSVIERSGRELVKRPEIVLSNLVLAHYLKTGRAASEIGALQEAVQVLLPRESDVALIKSNLAALQIYGGDIRSGLSVLQETASAIAEVADFSAYSIYFVNSNLAVAAYLTLGDIEAAGALATAERAMPDLEPDLAPYAKERLQLLKAAFENRAERSTSALQRYVDYKQHRIGETWRLHGRPLALSDLQYWSDS
jgi:tetratricopeptide (TPR) repeat protein